MNKVNGQFLFVTEYLNVCQVIPWLEIATYVSNKCLSYLLLDILFSRTGQFRALCCFLSLPFAQYIHFFGNLNSFHLNYTPLSILVLSYSSAIPRSQKSEYHDGLLFGDVDVRIDVFLRKQIFFMHDLLRQVACNRQVNKAVW